jgi:hypothetical protein
LPKRKSNLILGDLHSEDVVGRKDLKPKFGRAKCAGGVECLPCSSDGVDNKILSTDVDLH